MAMLLGVFHILNHAYSDDYELSLRNSTPYMLSGNAPAAWTVRHSPTNIEAFSMCTTSESAGCLAAYDEGSYGFQGAFINASTGFDAPEAQWVVDRVCASNSSFYRFTNLQAQNAVLSLNSSGALDVTTTSESPDCQYWALLNGSSIVSLPLFSNVALPTVTASPSSTSSPNSDNDNGSTGGPFSLSDKIGLGIGIGVGLPAALVALGQIWLWLSRALSRLPRPKLPSCGKRREAQPAQPDAEAPSTYSQDTRFPQVSTVVTEADDSEAQRRETSKQRNPAAVDVLSEMSSSAEPIINSDADVASIYWDPEDTDPPRTSDQHA